MKTLKQYEDEVKKHLYGEPKPLKKYDYRADIGPVYLTSDITSRMLILAMTDFLTELQKLTHSPDQQ